MSRKKSLAQKFSDVFSKRTAEKIYNDGVGSDKLLDYFWAPSNYVDIFSEESTIIEGAKGSGKSMLFYHFYLVKKEIGENESDIAIPFIHYIQPAGYENFHSFQFTSEEDFKIAVFDYFISQVLILFIHELEKINIYDPSKVDLSSLNLIFRNYTNFSDTEINFALESISNLKTLFIRNEKKVAKYHEVKRLQIDHSPKINNFRFLFKFFKSLSNWNLMDKSITPFLLIDQYEELSPDQQLVINIILSQRDPSLYIKAGCVNGQFLWQAYPKQTITKDNILFEKINPLQSTRITKEVETFFSNIITRRVNSIIPDFSIHELLGDSISLTDRAVSGRFEYFGFQDIIRISSGIIRNFLEICKSMINRAIENGNLNDSRIVSKLDKKIQIEVIQEYSDEEMEILDGIPNGFGYTRFLQWLASNIRKRIKSDISHKFTTDFKIRQFEKLSPEARSFLREAERYSVLLTPAKAAIDTQYRIKTYRINGKFVPNLNLLLKIDDIYSISYSEFQQIFDKINSPPEISKFTNATSLEDYPGFEDWE